MNSIDLYTLSSDRCHEAPCLKESSLFFRASSKKRPRKQSLEGKLRHLGTAHLPDELRIPSNQTGTAHPTRVTTCYISGAPFRARADWARQHEMARKDRDVRWARHASAGPKCREALHESVRALGRRDVCRGVSVGVAEQGVMKWQRMSHVPGAYVLVLL